jgi:thiamine pyrophosphokinase
VTAPHVLLVGSAPVSPEDIRRARDGADHLICADGGTDAALAAGLRPDLVLGDMDSITAQGRLELTRQGVRTVTFPREKDQTDLDLAFDYALMLQPSRITVLGALGGERLDHTLGNILLLAQPRLRAIDVRLVDDRGCAFAVWDQRELDGQKGDYLSLLSLTAEVAGIYTQGLKYALHNGTLELGSTRGLSNELEDSHAVIRVATGCLLVRREGSRPGGG